MSLWSRLLGSLFDTSGSDENLTATCLATGAVNPATGLPMVSGDNTGIDIGGSPFGFDLQSSADSDSFDGFDS